MSHDSPAQPSGSRTITIESTSQPESGPSQPHHRDVNNANTVGVLKLRGAPARRQRVMWTEETVDNEGMGKKKSKICCIYHRPKAYDESSTESDSSCSDSEGHSHAHRPRRRGKQAMRKKADGGGGEVEQSSSSESEGGQGNGSAKPAKRAPRNHRHPPHDHAHSSKPNRYDHQDKGPQPAAVKG